jgi:D-methionine transport system ATP-binding protein
MTVQDALAYPLVLQNFTPGQIKETVGTWIEKFHIPSAWLDRTEQQLSLGQRQWVGICRALVLQPAVLLLDEPTSALDQGRAEDLLHILGELHQQQQTTILMVNHQLDIAQQFATKLIYLHAGELTIEAQAPEIPWEAIAQNLQTHQQQLHQEWGE